jgi:hypothetical protein
MGQTVMTFSGEPGPTTKITASDAAQNLSAIFDNTSGRPAIGAVITCEANDVRFTMGGNITTPTYPPTQGAAGLGHVLYSGQSLYLSSGPTVRTFQFINYTTQDNAIIQVTPLFERG